MKFFNYQNHLTPLIITSPKYIFAWLLYDLSRIVVWIAYNHTNLLSCAQGRLYSRLWINRWLLHTLITSLNIDFTGVIRRISWIALSLRIYSLFVGSTTVCVSLLPCLAVQPFYYSTGCKTVHWLVCINFRFLSVCLNACQNFFYYLLSCSFHVHVVRLSDCELIFLITWIAIYLSFYFPFHAFSYFSIYLLGNLSVHLSVRSSLSASIVNYPLLYVSIHVFVHLLVYTSFFFFLPT